MISHDEIASDDIHIEAPVETVWNILIDFNNYHQWNKFCPQAEGKLEVGAPIKMVINMGLGPMDWQEYIMLIEPNKAIAWGLENKPDDPLKSMRTQSLVKLSEDSCRYTSVDKFWGDDVTDNVADLDAALARALQYTGPLSIAAEIEKAFNICGGGLKHYAEQYRP